MNPALNNLRQWAGGQGAMLQGISAPLLVVAILALMVLPIPAWLLDTFFTLNIAIALMDRWAGVRRPACAALSCTYPSPQRTVKW